MLLLGLVFLCGLALAALPTPGSLQEVTGWGPNPRNVKFHIYVPTKLPSSPGILAVIHFCTGTGPRMYNSPHKNMADKYGLVVIYPTSPHQGTCWDVSSKATLSHDGGGESQAIADMVRWVTKNYKADTTKVFAVGMSSGAMMTVSSS